MPLSADPDRTVDFWLESDADKPIESRPVFVCRFMGFGEHKKIEQLLHRALALPKTDEGDEQWIAILREILGIGLVGWRNVAWPFSLDTVIEKLTALELWELSNGYRYASRMSEVDLKKSASPSTSAEPPASAADGPKRAA